MSDGGGDGCGGDAAVRWRTAVIAVPARSSGAGLQVSGSVLFAPSPENGREVSGPDRRFGSPTALGPKALKPGSRREVSVPVYWEEGRNR